MPHSSSRNVSQSLSFSVCFVFTIKVLPKELSGHQGHFHIDYVTEMPCHLEMVSFRRNFATNLTSMLTSDVHGFFFPFLLNFKNLLVLIGFLRSAKEEYWFTVSSPNCILEEHVLSKASLLKHFIFPLLIFLTIECEQFIGLQSIPPV